MNKNIKYIFFDIGSTLIDESKCYKKRYQEIANNSSVTADKFEQKSIEFAKQNKKGDHEAAKFYGLTVPKWHKELELPYSNTYEILSYLSSNGYKLGVIANQSPGTVERLQNWNLLHFFDTVIASAEVGVSKPNTEIFQIALSHAHCLPGEAVMIGDRLDNDIIPAKSLGMTTIWIKQGFAKYAEPKCENEVADYTINSLSALKDIFY